IPRVSAHAGMDLSIIAEAFVVTVVGGMGSVPGAFLAALIIGQLQAFGILIFPKSTLVVVFLLMVIAALAAFPLVADAYLLKVATEILIFALFAFSLQLLIGVGGLVSFG